MVPQNFDQTWHEMLAVHRRLIALAWFLNLSINSWWFCSMSWRPFGEFRAIWCYGLEYLKPYESRVKQLSETPEFLSSICPSLASWTEALWVGESSCRQKTLDAIHMVSEKNTISSLLIGWDGWGNRFSDLESQYFVSMFQQRFFSSNSQQWRVPTSLRMAYGSL